MAAMGMEAATTTEHHHEHGTAAAVATVAVTVDAAVAAPIVAAVRRSAREPQPRHGLDEFAVSTQQFNEVRRANPAARLHAHASARGDEVTMPGAAARRRRPAPNVPVPAQDDASPVSSVPTSPDAQPPAATAAGNGGAHAGGGGVHVPRPPRRRPSFAGSMSSDDGPAAGSHSPRPVSASSSDEEAAAAEERAHDNIGKFGKSHRHHARDKAAFQRMIREECDKVACIVCGSLRPRLKCRTLPLDMSDERDRTLMVPLVIVPPPHGLSDMHVRSCGYVCMY